MGSQLWHHAAIVALDLEGSGAQDRDCEAILEVALVPLHDGQPALDRAFTSLVDPGRSIPQRPWLAPGLTDDLLATAPRLEQIAAKLAELIDGRWLLGHNVNVDWRLLRRHLPGLRPAGLIDSLALARSLNYPKRSLSALVEQLGLTPTMQAAAPGSQPHRAYWDTVAAAYLLPALVDRRWPHQPPTFDNLRTAAGIPHTTEPAEQPALFE